MAYAKVISLSSKDELGLPMKMLHVEPFLNNAT